MTDIELFKIAFPDCEYDEADNEIKSYTLGGDISATLFHAKESIEEYFGDNNYLETNEPNPEDRTRVKVDASDYILTEFLNYQEAFKAI